MNESNIKGLSIRAIIACLIVLALCYVCIINPTDGRVGILKDIAIMILSYYFGQKSNPTVAPDTKTTVESTTLTPKAPTLTMEGAKP